MATEHSITLKPVEARQATNAGHAKALPMVLGLSLAATVTALAVLGAVLLA